MLLKKRQNKLSWTSLNTYEQCPFKWKRQYLEGCWGPTNITLQFGLAMHNLGEDVFRTGEFDPKYWTQLWEEKYFRPQLLKGRLFEVPANVYSYNLNKGYKAIWTFFRSGDEYNLFKKQIPKELIEMDLSGVFQGYVLKGASDLLIPYKDGYILVDLKTSCKERDEYARQLTLYAEFLRKRGFKIYKLAVWYMCLGKFVYVKYDRRDLVKEVYNVIKGMNAEQYPARENEYCKYCHLKAECPLKAKKSKKVRL